MYGLFYFDMKSMYENIGGIRKQRLLWYALFGGFITKDHSIMEDRDIANNEERGSDFEGLIRTETVPSQENGLSDGEISLRMAQVQVSTIREMPKQTEPNEYVENSSEDIGPHPRHPTLFNGVQHFPPPYDHGHHSPPFRSSHHPPPFRPSHRHRHRPYESIHHHPPHRHPHHLHPRHRHPPPPLPGHRHPPPPHPGHRHPPPPHPGHPHPPPPHSGHRHPRHCHPPPPHHLHPHLQHCHPQGGPDLGPNSSGVPDC
ncbi:uncharacterized protein LOC134716044 isoform X1 [Mytilus trossulus]|uniref:uncharacterized protein LOC134716044 isoform X1 n=2 Tax=Mytilus trossulus TaxID=6551 RepID=UPI0030057481